MRLDAIFNESLTQLDDNFSLSFIDNSSIFRIFTSHLLARNTLSVQENARIRDFSRKGVRKMFFLHHPLQYNLQFYPANF
uniref:Uncharacterized protein n=1 Tax=Caenorhabditis japonica TaxID=281687 RepID=A0A8R1EMW0_CAEJA